VSPPAAAPRPGTAGAADATDNLGRRLRVFTTPEDLPLPLVVGSGGARVAAFAIDLLLMTATTVILALLLALLAGAAGLRGAGLFGALFLLIHFVLWNGYFLFFELRWQGRTPGKRSQGLRVVSRDGGPLGTGAIFGRNLMRDLEFYLPAQALLMPGLLYGPAPGWAALIACGWLFLFLLFPLFNRDRARVGDLVAGTLVVVRPAARLLPDVAERAPAAGPAGGGWSFTPEQLDMYGIRELHVLEQLLREADTRPDQAAVLRLVCDKIGDKIGWRDAVPDARVESFLQTFYRAQRHRLEHRLLLGDRRERKKSGRLAKR
jgi:uncharacterized RDD family membrane protein YckC